MNNGICLEHASENARKENARKEEDSYYRWTWIQKEKETPALVLAHR